MSRGGHRILPSLYLTAYKLERAISKYSVDASYRRPRLNSYVVSWFDRRMISDLKEILGQQILQAAKWASSAR